MRRHVIIYLVALVVCGGVYVAYPIVRSLVLLAARRHKAVRESVAVEIPGGVHRIEHTRIGNGPAAKEYSRNISFLSNGRIAKTKPLAIDTCGGYPINCYYIKTKKGEFLRLDDAVSEHLLDLKKEMVYLVARVENVAYIGELLDERAASGWSMSNGDPSTLAVIVGKKPAIAMNEFLGNYREQYIGQIAGGYGNFRFIPASEKPEVPIRKLWER